jgi:hypothetical protein
MLHSINTLDEQQQQQHEHENRPKTSRGKSHPSPDEFYSYIITSPNYEQLVSSTRLHNYEHHENYDRHENYGDTGVNDVDNSSGSDRDKQMRMLGCWLFGSLLRM